MVNKKSFSCYLLLTILLVNPLKSQIGVSPTERVRSKLNKFDKQDLKALKSSKTIFIYREGDDEQELREAIESVWTITDISLLSYHDYINEEIDFSNTSIFSIGSFTKSTSHAPSFSQNPSVQPRMHSHSPTIYKHTHAYLKLWMKVPTDKGSFRVINFSRVELYPDVKDYKSIENSKVSSTKFLYTKSEIKNWEPGFIKAYLKNVNDLLENEEERWLFQSETDEEVISLSENVLYIPDYLFYKYNRINVDDKKKLNIDKKMKKYPYEYKILEADEISKKILESEEPIYFLVYIISSTDKYLTIYNSKTGNILYAKYTPMAIRLKKSNFKKIAKSIKRELRKSK